MDQLKTYLAVLKKHHFWPLAVGVVLIGWYAWRSGAKHYDQLYAEGSSKLTSVFNEVNGVTSNRPHPNQYFIAEVKDLKTRQLEDVKSAWQLLYDKQKDILTWDKVYAKIGDLKPTAEIPQALRKDYWNYVKYQIPKLFEIIPIREEAKTGNVAADPPPGEAQPARKLGESNTDKKSEPTGIVVWPESERNRIVNAYEWDKVPRTKQIRNAQEDYWVYSALLNIIQETNGTVKSARNAAIKKIETLDIAQDVPPPSSQAFPVPEGTVFAGEEQPAERAKSGSGGPTDEELDNGRYVSADGNPLPAPDMSAQFKLMPIRMRLIIDERRLPDLLVACANSALPVEVRQVQFNASATADRPSSGRAGGGRALGGGGGGRSGMTSSRAPSSPTRQASFDPLIEQTQYDQRIEIRGFIYIFNQPDLSQLGDEAAEGSSDETMDEATPEADATPEAEAEIPAAEEPAAEIQPAGEPAADDNAAPAEGENEPPATEEGPPTGGEAPPSDEPPAEEPSAEVPPAEEPPADDGSAPPG